MKRRRTVEVAVEALGTPQDSISVVLVTHDLEVGSAIGMLFDLDERFTLAACVADRRTAAPAVLRSNPAVVVVDLDPGDGRVDVIRHLRSLAPRAKLVAFSSFPDFLTLMAVLRSGADAYIDKATAWIDLIPTVCELCELPGARHPADA
jgi:DNA-binding NarL/FixJ family response regulator